MAEGRRRSSTEARLQPHQFRLLIDENLTPGLVKFARRRGFAASHVNEVNLRSVSDQAIARFALKEDLIVVTNNMVDFSKLYARRKAHPGLIFLAGREGALTREVQTSLLDVALDDILENDLLQEVVLVRLVAVGNTRVRYELTRHELPLHQP